MLESYPEVRDFVIWIGIVGCYLWLSMRMKKLEKHISEQGKSDEKTT